MARRDSGSVRIGPISIFVLIITLCLCVMAVLAVTTAQASDSEAHRQSDFVASAYSNEVEAQEFVAKVDGILERVSREGGDVVSAGSALTQELIGEAIVDASEDGVQIDCEFSTEDGRMLVVTLHVRADLTYQIEQWKLMSQWSPESIGTLWAG